MFCSDVAAALKVKAVETLASLVHHDKVNQTAAASAGAVAELLQLARSDDAALQLAAVRTLGCLVHNHKDNQTAATNAGAVKGGFVKFKPLQPKFMQMHNPKAILYYHLRSFAALTIGMVSTIHYNGRDRFELEVRAPMCVCLDMHRAETRHFAGRGASRQIRKEAAQR